MKTDTLPLSTAAEITHRLRRRILQGEFPAGATIPAERNLAKELGVSRLTLRSAIAHLASEGLLRPMHGSGTVVLDYRERGGLDLFGYVGQLALDRGTIPVELLADFLEVRRTIAVLAISLATQRATDEEIEQMRKQLAVMQGCIDDAQAFRAADIHFARLVVRAGHNLALELLFNTIVRCVENHPSFEAAFAADRPGTLALYQRVSAIIASRRQDTETLARKLLERLDRRVVRALTQLSEAMKAAQAPTHEAVA